LLIHITFTSSDSGQMKLNSMTYVCLSVAFLASATEGDTIRGASSTTRSYGNEGLYYTFNLTNIDKLVGDSGVVGEKDDKSTDGVENEDNDGDDEKELSKLPTPTPSALPTTSSNGTSTTEQPIWVPDVLCGGTRC